MLNLLLLRIIYSDSSNNGTIQFLQSIFYLFKKVIAIF